MKKTSGSILSTVIGTLITAVGISLFLSPNKIVGGGVSGIAIILYNSINIPIGLSFGVINLVLLILGFKILGKDFILKTILGAGLISVFSEVFSYFPPATDNVVLGTIFGGVLYGFGIGLALASGSSTGGGDIIGRLIQHKFKSLPIGRILMLVDGVIILSSLFVFNDIDLVLFGVISMFISNFVIDRLISTLNVSKMAFVITDKGEEISNRIVTSSPRGVTMIDAKGGYTNNDKKLLFCAMKDKEAPTFQKKILEIDENAFVVFAESQQIVGNGFHVYH